MFIKSITHPARDYFGRKITKVIDYGKYRGKHIIIHQELYNGVTQNKTFRIWNDKFEKIAYKSRNRTNKFDTWA